MASGDRKRADDALLLALACGAPVKAAAERAGVSERTAYRRLDDPEFHQQLEAARTDLFRRASGMLSAAGTESIRTLVSLQDASQQPSVRLGAAKAVLELELKFREKVELEPRVSLLEQRLNSTKEAG